MASNSARMALAVGSWGMEAACDRAVPVALAIPASSPTFNQSRVTLSMCLPQSGQAGNITGFLLKLHPQRREPAPRIPGHDRAGSAHRLEIALVKDIVDIELGAEVSASQGPPIGSKSVPFDEPGQHIVVGVVAFSGATRDHSDSCFQASKESVREPIGSPHAAAVAWHAKEPVPVAANQLRPIAHGIGNGIGNGVQYSRADVGIAPEQLQSGQHFPVDVELYPLIARRSG